MEMDPSTPQSSTPTESRTGQMRPPPLTIRKREKKRKASCWEHADEYEKVNEKGDVVEIFARCLHCQSEFAADSKKHGNNGINNHLKRCKSNPDRQVISDSSQTTITQSGFNNALIPHSYNKQRLDTKVVEFIIRDEQPFRVVEGAGFIAMMKEAQPKYKVLNRHKVRDIVWLVFRKEKAKIKDGISGQRVSITTDTWTSVQNINYMVITAHFLDSDWKLHKRIINFTKITSHKGDDIGNVLETCLNEWGIEKVFTITVDNASSNDKAVEYMGKRLDDMGTQLLNGKYLHMRCACHIINLIVKSGLELLATSIESIRNCVKYIHSSGTRLDHFREYAILLKMDKMSTVPLDVSTRWNSTYTMLKDAYKFRKVFSRMNENALFRAYFVEKNNKGETRLGPPNDVDWEKSLVFMDFLKRFNTTTLKLSASKRVTSSLVWEEVALMGASINEALKDTTNAILQEVAVEMDTKLKKYWGNLFKVNRLIFIAHILDPQYKFQMMNIHLELMGLDTIEIELFVKELKDCLMELYHAYKGCSPSETFGGDLGSEVDTKLMETLKDDPIKLNIYLRMADQRRSQNVVEIANEVDKYLSDPCENLSGNFSILEWWKVNTTRFPILSRISKDILAIPASTVASESAFSLGRRIVDPFRASLQPKMVEALVCTSDWLRGEEINLYKEPTEEELEFYLACEEVTSKSCTTSVDT